MKSIKELKTNEHIGMNDYGYGYKQALKDVLKLIDKRLEDAHRKLANPELPEMTQANLSGMILALEELKAGING